MDGPSALPPVIRRVRPDEWRLLRSARLRSLSDEPEAFGQRVDDALATPDAEWRSLARQASSGDRRAWFLAHAAGADPDVEVVGLVQGRRRPPSDVMVFSMWVDPGARRTGLGRRLIETVALWAAGWGGRRMVLWVFAANEPAIRFYRGIGFRLLTSGPDAEAGVPHGAHAMVRSVRPDPGPVAA